MNFSLKLQLHRGFKICKTIGIIPELRGLFCFGFYWNDWKMEHYQFLKLKVHRDFDEKSLTIKKDKKIFMEAVDNSSVDELASEKTFRQISSIVRFFIKNFLIFKSSSSLISKFFLRLYSNKQNTT